MAQIPMRGNLNAANIPLLSNLFGRSIIIPQQDQNYQRSSIVGQDAQLDKGIPQVYYGHNIMPTGQGIQSVAFKRFIKNVVGVNNFDKVYTVRDGLENKGLIGITTTGKVYLITTASNGWVDVTPGGGWVGGYTSVAVVNGVSYICLSLFNVYTVNILSPALVVAGLTGISGPAVVGISGAANYMILHDNTTIYWSSTITPTDFVPSLITGAGSGNPTDLEGIIVGLGTFSSGFAVFTTTNIVLASYSGNSRFPWIFRGATNSSGIRDIEQIAVDGDNGSNYAWTAAGLLKINAQGCTAPFPEVTDFLAGRLFEDFSDATKVFTRTKTNANFAIKLIFVASRYLVISYGLTTLTHALVYDSSLQRWGKLKTTHVDCFELGLDGESNRRWIDLVGQGWNTKVNVAWQDSLTLGNKSASPKRTIAFLAADGSCQYVVFDAEDITAAGAVIIGKYQLLRSEMVTLEQVDVENTVLGAANFSMTVMSAVDGKNPTNYIPYLKTSTKDFKSYLAHVTAINHSLLFQGSFGLTSLEVTFSRHGSST